MHSNFKRRLVLTAILVAVTILTIFGILARTRDEPIMSGSKATNRQKHGSNNAGSVMQLPVPPITEEPPPVIIYRNEFGKFLESMGFKTGIEIGVQKGIFAERMLSQWPSATKYYLVDPWEEQKNYIDRANVNQNEQERFMTETKERLKQFGDKVVFLRQYSSDAVEHFRDESIDFIYIDARHDYNGVAEDLTLYYPKIKKGGLVAGHDYLDQYDLDRVDPSQKWEVNADGTVNKGAVKGAVDDFAKKYNKKIYTTPGDAPWISWYFIK